MNWICVFFGHKFELTCNFDEMWIRCARNGCKHIEDVPENRTEEAYRNLREKIFTWIK